MFLTIVECGDYRKYRLGNAQEIAEQTLNDLIQYIGPVVGPSASHMRNWGAQRAQGVWILFQDSSSNKDVKRMEGWVQLLMDLPSDVAAVGGLYQSNSTGYWTQTYHEIQRRWVLRGLNKTKLNGLFDANHLFGGALAVRREIFLSMGGFDEKIGYGAEELDLIHRFRQSGFKTLLSARLLVKDPKKISFYGFLNRAWKQNYNRGYFRLNNQRPVARKKSFYFGTFKRRMVSTGIFFTTALVAEKSGQLTRYLVERKH